MPCAEESSEHILCSLHFRHALACHAKSFTPSTSEPQGICICQSLLLSAYRGSPPGSNTNEQKAKQGQQHQVMPHGAKRTASARNQALPRSHPDSAPEDDDPAAVPFCPLPFWPLPRLPHELLGQPAGRQTCTQLIQNGLPLLKYEVECPETHRHALNSP